MNMTLSQILKSDTPLVCVVQGGGMRGTYSIAALAELEAQGYTNRFEAIYGSSAGALNGAYFLASQAGDGVGIYVDYLSGKQFINPARISPIIDIDYLVDDVLQQKVPLNQAAVVTSPTDLIIFLTNALTGEGERFHARDAGVPLMELFRATAALPIVFGREIEVNGQKYSDGGLFDQVPLQEAMDDGWQNILVILTRPISHEVKPATPLKRWFAKALARIAGHSPGVVRLLGSNRERMKRVMAIVSGQYTDVPSNVWVIAPSDAAVLASRLTNSKEILLKTAESAHADARAALEQGPAVEARPSK